LLFSQLTFLSIIIMIPRCHWRRCYRDVNPLQHHWIHKAKEKPFQTNLQLPS